MTPGHQRANLEAAREALRIGELMDVEQLILNSLTDAYQRGKIEYLHFSAAWDVTAARLAALSWAQEWAEITSDSDNNQNSGEAI